MISAGTLNERVEILEPHTVTNDVGEQVTEYTLFCRTRVGDMTESGRRVLQQGAVMNPRQRTFIMRYRPGIHFRQRVRMVRSGETYVIEDVNESVSDGRIRLTVSSIAE